MTMDNGDTPPPVPSRQHSRPKSLPAKHSRRRDANRVHLQSASPEVISSLITSLSVIPIPAELLLDRQTGNSRSTPVSPAPGQSSFGFSDGNRYSLKTRSSGSGSFGIDYGAYRQPPMVDDMDGTLLDELPASPPVIRTSKPPSGFSPLTAPKSPATRDQSPFRNFIRGSRPSSRGSTVSKDREEANSIGRSTEPGLSSHQPELRKQTSSDSWGRSNSRKSKGLMYMSSKEQLSEKEQEKRSSIGGTASSSKITTNDRLSLSHFDTDSFMAATAINEEPSNVLSPSNGFVSPIKEEISLAAPIPPRDSSLRMSSLRKKHSSHLSSQLESKQKDGEKDSGIIQEADERQGLKVRDGNVPQRRQSLRDIASKFMEPLVGTELLSQAKPLAPTTKQMPETAETEQDANGDEGASAPKLVHRRSMIGDSRGNRDRKSTTLAPEPPEKGFVNRSSSRLKRGSTSASKSGDENSPYRNSSVQPASRKTDLSAEPRPSAHLVEERPSSSDSIDDAVDAYLCSPRLSQKIQHPQTGRIISFSEVGDAEGFAVFCCVGMGLTRYLTAFYDELARTLKLRLITPDRPGVGDSEPHADGTSTPLSWPGKLIR
jgi:hypothetical protein